MRLKRIHQLRKPLCDHNVFFPEPEYYEALGIDKMNSQQIREKYPRLFGNCPKGCGYSGIAYASSAHFYFGDW